MTDLLEFTNTKTHNIGGNTTLTTSISKEKAIKTNAHSYKFLAGNDLKNFTIIDYGGSTSNFKNGKKMDSTTEGSKKKILKS